MTMVPLPIIAGIISFRGRTITGLVPTPGQNVPIDPPQRIQQTTGGRGSRSDQVEQGSISKVGVIDRSTDFQSVRVLSESSYARTD